MGLGLRMCRIHERLSAVPYICLLNTPSSLVLLRTRRHEGGRRPMPVLRHRPLPELHHPSSYGPSRNRSPRRYPGRGPSRRVNRPSGVWAFGTPKVRYFSGGAGKTCLRGYRLSCIVILHSRISVLTALRRVESLPVARRWVRLWFAGLSPFTREQVPNNGLAAMSPGKAPLVHLICRLRWFGLDTCEKTDMRQIGWR